MENLNSKIIKGSKWASITEIIAKLITPITNMILARILVPEEFGVIATVTMIISFADMFTDAGFQKYLVQHEFESEEEEILSTNVAFWTNIGISLFLWILIIIYSDKLAIMIGNDGLGHVISIACIQLPMTSFSSIQMAIYRRNFDFKTLFLVRIISICIPFIVTIPLALLGFSYWALIIGTLCGVLSNAIILTIKSHWKPKFLYRVSILKQMLSFSIWSLVESMSIWLTAWIDTFIIGTVLNSYYLGIYKTSLTTVNSILSLITASTTPILFSALSRMQKDHNQFNNIFFDMQRFVSYLILPMSVGVFLYSDLVVRILLGEGWRDASYVIGIWSLTSGITMVIGNYSSEVYRAKGRPKLSFIAQILHLVVLIPVCIIGLKYNFITFISIRSIIRLQGAVIHLIFMHYMMNIKIYDILKNIYIPLVCSITMGVIGITLKMFSDQLIWNVISIAICIVLYISILFMFKVSKRDMLRIINRLNLCDKVRNKVLIK